MSSQRLIRRLVPGLVAVVLLALPATSPAAPRNDDFQSATALDLIQRDDPPNRTNVDATEQTDEPLTPSGAGNCDGAQLTNTVWYVVPGDGGPVTLDTRGSGIDSVVAVYNTHGTATQPTTGNLIDCADDIDNDDLASELTFDSQDGVDYLVQIGTCTGCGSGLPDEGTVDFIGWPAPPNDNRGAPTALASGTPITSYNIGATVENNEQTRCGVEPFGKTVWFRFTAPGPGIAVFSSSGSFFDSVLTVYRGSAVVDCNDDVAGQQGPSRVSTHVTAGDYLIQVGGHGAGAAAERDLFTAQVEFTADPPPPPPPPPDRDGDGVPDSRDRCPDQNARARDADGDGCLDPLPLKTLRSTVTSKFAAFRRYTKVSVLVANNLPAGSKVKVTCRATKHRKRCPKARTVNVRKARGKLNLRRPFRKRRLPVGTVLTVQITAPGYVGKVIRYRMRKRRLPRTTQLCLQPGAKRPGACE